MNNRSFNPAGCCCLRRLPAGSLETQFVDSTPFVTPTAVSVVAGARGNSTASVVYLESYN